MSKLLIIDGHNLLFQMFFGMPSRIINKGGIAIHGVLGFTGALLKIIKMTKPTHVIVIFDGEHENSRTKVNADYKANRTDYSTVAAENNPFSQLEYIYAALEFLGIKHIEVTDGEADDAIASYVFRYNKEIDIVISSFDSDFFQLIGEKVSLLRYRGKITAICDVQYIKEKLNIFPAQYADFKSLTGDTSDNIKGAYKIGPLTAAKLINQFGSLENVICRADEIDKQWVKDTICAEASRLLQNYSIIKLSGKASPPFSLDMLEYNYTGLSTNEVLLGIGLK